MGGVRHHGPECPAIAVEQRLYARVVGVGSAAALCLLVVALAVYVTGLVPAFVPLAELPRYWGLSSAEFVRAAQCPTGWMCVRWIRYGDYLSLAGIALLSSVTIAGYVVLLWVYSVRRDFLYGAIVACELVVLGLAASGLVVGGH